MKKYLPGISRKKGDDLDILSKRYSYLETATCHNDLDLVKTTMADPCISLNISPLRKLQ